MWFPFFFDTLSFSKNTYNDYDDNRITPVNLINFGFLVSDGDGMCISIALFPFLHQVSRNMIAKIITCHVKSSCHQKSKADLRCGEMLK